MGEKIDVPTEEEKNDPGQGRDPKHHASLAVALLVPSACLAIGVIFPAIPRFLFGEGAIITLLVGAMGIGLSWVFLLRALVDRDTEGSKAAGCARVRRWRVRRLLTHRYALPIVFAALYACFGRLGESGSQVPCFLKACYFTIAGTSAALPRCFVDGPAEDRPSRPLLLLEFSVAVLTLVDMSSDISSVLVVLVALALFSILSWLPNPFSRENASKTVLLLIIFAAIFFFMVNTQPGFDFAQAASPLVATAASAATSVLAIAAISDALTDYLHYMRGESRDLSTAC